MGALLVPKKASEADTIFCLQCPGEPSPHLKLAVTAWNKCPGTKSLGNVLAGSLAVVSMDVIVPVHISSSGASIPRPKPASGERLPPTGVSDKKTSASQGTDTGQIQTPFNLCPMGLNAFYLQTFVSGTFPFLILGWQSSAMVDGMGCGVGPA